MLKKRLVMTIVALCISLTLTLALPIFSSPDNIAIAKSYHKKKSMPRTSNVSRGSHRTKKISKGSKGSRRSSKRQRPARRSSRSKRTSRRHNRKVAYAPTPIPAPTPTPTPPAVVATPIIYTPSPDRIQALKNKTLAGDKSKIIIAVDAGHGGNDSGAVTRDDTGTVILAEKEVNLKVALKLQQLLQTAGYTVVMTRTTDVYVTLTDRASIANNANADIFVSIHHNSTATTETAASGSETYSYPGSQSGAALAAAIETELVNSLWSGDPNKKRGSFTADFSVLRNTVMTAELSEAAFMNNRSDAALLATDDFCQKEAQGIFNGISSYLNQLLNNKST